MRESIDSILHYIVCVRLWRSVEHATKRSPSNDIYVRLGLNNNIRDIHNLSVAFTTYHSVRNKYRTVYESAIRNRKYEALLTLRVRQIVLTEPYALVLEHSRHFSSHVYGHDKSDMAARMSSTFCEF